MSEFSTEGPGARSAADDSLNPEGRRRRRRHREEAEPSDRGGRSGNESEGEAGAGGTRGSVVAMAGVGGIALFAMLAAGTGLTFLHGGVWLAFGILLLVLPPAQRISGWWLTAGLLLLAGGGLAFLPVEWFGAPEWRRALEALGLATGERVTVQPVLSAQLLAGLAVSVVAAWYVTGHRIPDRAHLPLALGVALGIAGYAVVSMLAYQAKPAWSWDPVNTFGLYGNRNHTATVLVMGALTSLGVIMAGIRGNRGGVAGLATLSLAVCCWGILGYSISRAGVLLLGLGLILWLGGLGSRYISRRVFLSCLIFVPVIVFIFWRADTTVKKRVEQQWELMKAKAEASSAAEEEESGDGETKDAKREVSAAMEDQPLDFRAVIYEDTFRMLKSEPLTGVGLGQFPYLFPQYRHASMINAHCRHPESNWLALAAEAGWPTAVMTALAVGGFFWAGIRAARRRQHGWPLALGTLLAAAAVPFHGIFDMPAYHVGIAWTALILVAMNFRTVSPDGKALAKPAGIFSRGLFRVAGLVILAGGGWMLIQGEKRMVPALDQATVAIRNIRTLYTADVAEKADPANHPPELDAAGKPVDRLEVAQRIVNQSLAVTPLDQELQYFRGLLSVNFSDEEAVADQAFAVQRTLAPDWVDVPYRQGLAWMTIDPERALNLWREALRRSVAAEKIRKGVYWSPKYLMGRVSAAVKGHPGLQEAVRQLAADAEAG